MNNQCWPISTIFVLSMHLKNVAPTFLNDQTLNTKILTNNYGYSTKPKWTAKACNQSS